MTIHVSPAEFRRDLETDDAREFKLACWQLCPMGFCLEPPHGDVVLFDGAFRMIARITFLDERVEFLDPLAPLKPDAIGPTFLHQDFGLPLGKPARDKVAGYIEKYRLAPELRRRRELLRRGRLPSPADKLLDRWAGVNKPAGDTKQSAA